MNVTAALGSAALIAAMVGALWAAGASLVAVRRGPPWLASARRGVYVTTALVAFAVALLQGAFLRLDLTYAVVADHASAETPAGYRLAAVWASQEGSLLLWLMLLCLYSSAALYATRRRLAPMLPYATAVLAGLASFFLFLLVVLEPPFRTLTEPAPFGAGLMPLLRNPLMMAHPPVLYAGYAGFAVPFAFAIGALAARTVEPDWLRITRRHALMAWLFLAAGLLLGARWSYGELGWGGYWAWDPVENAALMPWLTATAFLHSAMVQERRGLLRVWTVSLIIATFALVLLGTLLVRSGILASIHAFGASTLGLPFVVLIGVVLFGSVALVTARRRLLGGGASIESPLSREAMLLINNFLLVGGALVVLWGTLFPLVSEAATGRAASVGPPWFERFAVPLGVTIVFATAVGTAMAWRRTALRRLARTLTWPVIAGLALGTVLSLITELEANVPAVLVIVGAAIAIGAGVVEWWRAVALRRRVAGESLPAAARRVTLANRRRYGGYLAHGGLAMAFVGIAASSAFEERRDARLRPGGEVRAGGYSISYRAPIVVAEDERIRFGAVLDVRHGDERFVVRPVHDRYASRDLRLGSLGRIFDGESTSEIVLRDGWGHDLWIAMQSDLTPLRRMIEGAERRPEAMDPGYQAAVLDAVMQRYRQEGLPVEFRVIVAPGVAWLWLGGLTILGGGLLALGPSRRRRRRTAADRADADTGIPAGTPAAAQTVVAGRQ